MPRFSAAFWVLSRVRRLLLKNTSRAVLFLPSCWSAKGWAFTAAAAARASFKSPNCFMLVKCFIW